MIQRAASKVMWVGRATVFLVGIADLYLSGRGLLERGRGAIPLKPSLAAEAKQPSSAPLGVIQELYPNNEYKDKEEKAIDAPKPAGGGSDGENSGDLLQRDGQRLPTGPRRRGGCQGGGAETRLRKAHELAPEEAIKSNQGWSDHALMTEDVPEASMDDLEWADAYVFGTPTRFGNVSAQLKQFLDQTGELWFQGKLADKVVGAFTSASTAHGGQETTIASLFNVFMHWGAIVVSLGYTDEAIFSTGNPYGASSTGEPTEEELAVARYQGRRIAEKAEALARSRV
jgi:NAD(P)H dehydrogenase (quinone)